MRPTSQRNFNKKSITLATDQKREKRERFTSPKGVFKYPNLTQPSDKFKAEGEYSVKLILDKTEAAAFRKRHAQALKDAIAEGQEEYGKMSIAARKKTKFSPQEELGTDIYDEATEKPTGQVEFKFSRVASGVSKKDGKPWSITMPIFDAKGTPLKNVDVWGGTVGKVSYELNPYFVPGSGAAGLGLRLVAAQVIELRTKGTAGAGAYGFGEEEGYEFDEDDSVPTEKVEDDSTEDEETDF